MPAALRVADGLGVGAIFALRFCKAFREKLHPAPFLFDRAGSKVNRPAADSAAGAQRQTSNFRHHVTVFHPSPLHALRRPQAAGRRCGRKRGRGRGRGRGESLGRGQNFHFQAVFGKSNSSFPPPPFFHIRCVRQRGYGRVLVFPSGLRCHHRLFRSVLPHNHTLPCHYRGRSFLQL